MSTDCIGLLKVYALVENNKIFRTKTTKGIYSSYGHARNAKDKHTIYTRNGQRRNIKIIEFLPEREID